MKSIEFFHIYTDEKIDQEKLDSLAEYQKYIISLNEPYSTYILIDDYTPKMSTGTSSSSDILQDVNSIRAFMSEYNVIVDAFAYESKLEANCYKVLEDIHPYDMRNYQKLINKNGKIPCSLFVLAWYLSRLGFYSMMDEDGNTLQVADEIVNILPYRYKKIDEIVTEVLVKSKYKSCVPRINSIYFNSLNNAKPNV